MRTIVFIITIALIGCEAGYNGDVITEQGYYECKSKTIPQAPVYMYDTRDNRTKVWIGTETYLEFYDINSSQIVKLREDNFNYECNCIGLNKRMKIN